MNCINVHGGVAALNFSSKEIEFNNKILFSDKKVDGDFDFIKIDTISNIKQYNDFMLSLGKYIKSPFVLVIQDDGHVINPKKWDEDYLKFDYIGAPWPNDKKWNSRWKKYNEVGEKIVHNLSFNRIGNGGFSLRSKKFLEYSSTFSDTTFLAEDIFLNIFNYDYAKNFGIKYPDIETAINFSYEIPLKGKSLEKKAKKESLNLNNHFGWHGKHFSNYQELLDLKFSR